MATAARGTGWDCPKCTFHNEDPDATVCQVCNQGRRPAGRSNGSRLRPPKAATPPLISSFADYDGDNKDSGAAAGARAGRNKGKSRQGKKRPETIEEEQEETAEPSKRPRANTRSSSRAREQQQRTESALVVEDSEEEEQQDGVDREVVSVAGGGDGLSDRAARDDDDGDDDDVDDSGETPLLFGRGWSTSEKKRARQRKLDKERESTGRKSGGAAASRQKGKKRQRPLPSYPGDDIFRNRTYAAVEDRPDDQYEDRPLALRRVVTGNGRSRPAWRWPPTPTTCGDYGGGSGAMSPGSRGAVRGDGGGDKTASSSCNAVDFVGGGGGAGAGEGGGRTLADSLVLGVQEQKPKKR